MSARDGGETRLSIAGARSGSNPVPVPSNLFGARRLDRAVLRVTFFSPDMIEAGAREKGRWIGAGYGLASATLFGLSTPSAKALLGAIDPWLLAGLLYLGSGAGLSLFAGRRIVIGALAILAGAVLLSLQSGLSGLGVGALAIAGACLAWGIATARACLAHGPMRSRGLIWPLSMNALRNSRN